MPAAPAIRLGPPHPYLKTHGGKVARLHRLDWAVLLLLAAADVGLNLVSSRSTASSARTCSRTSGTR